MGRQLHSFLYMPPRVWTVWQESKEIIANINMRTDDRKCPEPTEWTLGEAIDIFQETFSFTCLDISPKAGKHIIQKEGAT